MKYVTWLYSHHKYKNILISPLTIFQQISFRSLFDMNSVCAIYIITKRLYRLLRLPVDILRLYSCNELQRIYMLMEYTSQDNMLLLLKYCKLSKITKYNINDLIRIIADHEDITNGVISVKWGKGNYANIETNIKQHYIKHVLSEEGIYWKQVLPELTEYHYKFYTEKIFKRINKIVIHSNGRYVCLSGFYNNFFVVGKYEEGKFTISSCYYVVNGEKYGRYVDSCYHKYHSN